MRAGALDRRIQFLRATAVDDGLATRPGSYLPHGDPVWAGRQDIRDGEKVAAGSIYGEVSCRFTVRSTTFTRGITTKDVLVEGRWHFEIIGLKDLGRRDGIEITATARTDR